MRDLFGREINYLRISVTDRCNLRCVYCMPEEGIELIPHSEILSFERITEVARVAVRMGIQKIRLTGGEPLARKEMPALTRMLAEIPGLATLAMTTNGTLLAPLADELRAAGLDSVNVSLDTLDPAKYREITRGGEIAEAKAGVLAAVAAGLAVKINVVVSGDDGGEDVETLRDFAMRSGAAIQTISRYSLQERKRDGGEFDRPPPCSACNRLRLLANGTLRSCLHSDIDHKIDFSDIEGSILEAVRGKPARGAVSATRSVGQIGG